MMSPALHLAHGEQLGLPVPLGHREEELVDQQVVPDHQRVPHGGRGDRELLAHEGLEEHDQQHREADHFEVVANGALGRALRQDRSPPSPHFSVFAMPTPDRCLFSMTGLCRKNAFWPETRARGWAGLAPAPVRRAPPSHQPQRGRWPVRSQRVQVKKWRAPSMRFFRMSMGLNAVLALVSSLPPSRKLHQTMKGRPRRWSMGRKPQ